MSFKSNAFSFGKDKKEVQSIAKHVNIRDFNLETTLSDVLKISRLKDFDQTASGVSVKLVPSLRDFGKFVSADSKFYDTNYNEISGNTKENLFETLQKDDMTTETMKTVLYYFDSGGVSELMQVSPIVPLFIDSEFSSRMSETKKEFYDEISTSIETYVKDLIVYYYENKDTENIYHFNGKIFLGDFTPDNWSTNYAAGKNFTFKDLEDAGKNHVEKSEKLLNISMPKIDIIYSLNEDEQMGGAFLHDENTYKVVYEKIGTKKVNRAEFEKQYFEDTKHKGTIKIPMHTDPERKAIIAAIKGHVGDAETTQYFVRFMRYDDKYAFAVVSYTDNFQHMEGYLLNKNKAGKWGVIVVGINAYSSMPVRKESKYSDINFSILPTGFSNYYEVYNLDSYDEMKLYGGFGLPVREDASYYDVDFASYIDDFVYMRLDNPTGDRFLINLEAQTVTKITGYEEFLKLCKKGRLPPFIGLQLD